MLTEKQKELVQRVKDMLDKQCETVLYEKDDGTFGERYAVTLEEHDLMREVHKAFDMGTVFIPLNSWCGLIMNIDSKFGTSCKRVPCISKE